MADEEGPKVERVRTTDVMRIVLENHEKLMKFLFETYKYPLAAKLALDLVQSAHLSRIKSYLDEPDAQARMHSLNAMLATSLLLDHKAILESLKNGTFLEEWQPKIHAKIVEIRTAHGMPPPIVIAPDGTQSVPMSDPPPTDSLSEWIRERKKAVEGNG